MLCDLTHAEMPLYEQSTVTKAEKTMNEMSIVFSDLVLATRIRWHSVGIIRIIGTPSNAPDTPRN